MKKYKALFLVLFALTVLIPFNVYAGEVTQLNIIVDEPEEGNMPDFTADVELMDKDDNILLTVEDYPLKWAKIGFTDSTKVYLTEDDEFEEGYIYQVETDNTQVSKILEELTQAGHTVSEDEGTVFINGYNIEEVISYYVINGIEELNIIPGKLFAGETLPTSIKIEYTTPDGTFEEEVTDVDWYTLDNQNNSIYLDKDSVLEEGVKYYFEPNTDSKIGDLVDMRTIIKVNDKTIPNLDELALIAVDPMDDVNTIYDLFTEVEKALEDNDSKALKETVAEMTIKIELYNNLTDKQMDLLAEKLELEDGEEAFTYVLDKLVDANAIVSALEVIDTYVTNPTKENATALVEYIDSYKEMYGDTKDIERYYSNLNKIYGEAVNKKTESTKQEENPKTFDHIGNSIFMAIISLIGLVGTAIYLKMKNKVRA